MLGAAGRPRHTTRPQLPFLRERFSAEDSSQAQAEALRAMGRVGDRSQLPVLREASRQESHQNVVRRAAEWAIQEIEGGVEAVRGARDEARLGSAVTLSGEPPRG